MVSLQELSGYRFINCFDLFDNRFILYSHLLLPLKLT